MTLEKIKREFIAYMEGAHSGYPYPRNLFGCLLAILVEPNPVTQERIMELTGYSQTAVSLTIQKIQLLFPVKKIKKSGDRKHYYIYDGSPNSFLLDLTRKRVDVQDIDLNFIQAMLEKAQEMEKRSKSIGRFIDYLNNMKLYLSQNHALRTASADSFKTALVSGSMKGINLQDSRLLEEAELANFLKQLREVSSSANDSPLGKSESSDEYLSLKRDYFSGLKENLNPLYSQELVNRMIVFHYILLEGRATQDAIEEATLLPRSTVSESLKNPVERGLLKVQKKSRTKIYQSGISFVELQLGSYDRAALFFHTVNEKLSKLVKDAQTIRPVSENVKSFLSILETFEQAYSFTLAFSRHMKVEMVKILKDEYERGFVFI
jgi:DNA-binding transcriptional regulator GbsR (MarR family)